MTFDSPFCCEKMPDTDSFPNWKSVRNPHRFCAPEIREPAKGSDTLPASTFRMISSSFPS